MALQDRFGAFCPHGDIRIEGKPGGPLSGLSFAAKDLFDIAGHVTGAGNADWLATHEPAGATASAVQKLLDAGAMLAGKTITDELAYSLSGVNMHYGTPVNLAAPDRLPGGSSSGSAVAVAGGLVDTAIGTDTGGSVRVPANNCGLYGLRPTHGRIAVDGLVPLAGSFDTVGWFARDAATLARVGEVLLGPRERIPHGRIIIASDCFDLADPAARAVLEPALKAAIQAVGPRHYLTLNPEGFDVWQTAFRHIQGYEAWALHGEWITRTQPKMAPEIAERFQLGSKVTQAEFEAATAVRARVRARIAAVLQPGDVLCLPTSSGPAALKTISKEEEAIYRAGMLKLTCIAGLAGLPQVTLPLARLDGAPVGLSLAALPGSDWLLLDLAERIKA
ncbi:MAG: amidase [Alphaproteobacteria bacterium]|nr:amidase [Alphaproteobacteria bacterium]MBU0796873.1 amidase [Alphaproteobacteria bacterium]MBU0886931.1 amidase [Alphaproteobacteria bacterium]MBU1813213.1 amidase [Alphaproteobacteria bacterium]